MAKTTASSWLKQSLVRLIKTGALILMFALLGGCTTCQKPASSASFSPAHKAGELRAMTFNLRVRTVVDGSNIWDRRRDLVVERVRAFDPDLLGTQEGLDTMETYLREQLRDYTFFGAGRNDGKELGEMCGIYFRTARFEKLAGGHFWLSHTPHQPGSRAWGEVYPRMVTWVKLRPRDGGPVFCWFNTHFDAWVPRARIRSAELLQDQMRVIAAGLPCVVTGDFNSAAGSASYRRLLAAPQEPPCSPLHDAFRAAHPVAGREEGTVHFFTGWRKGARMDWIFTDDHFEVVTADIDHTRGPHGYPSDHFPVAAVLRFTSPR